jgi:hypothetical protein
VLKCFDNVWALGSGHASASASGAAGSPLTVIRASRAFTSMSTSAGCCHLKRISAGMGFARIVLHNGLPWSSRSQPSNDIFKLETN